MEGDLLEDPRADWRIILKLIVNKYAWRAWSFIPTQHWDKFLAVVNAMLNLRVS
jgi:hypothetical protein